MPLLDIAVLVGLRNLDATTFHAVVRQKGLVALCEHLRVDFFVDRCAQAVRPVIFRYSPSFHTAL